MFFLLILILFFPAGSSDLEVWLPLKANLLGYLWTGINIAVTADHPLWPFITRPAGGLRTCFRLLYTKATGIMEVRSHYCLDAFNPVPLLCMTTNFGYWDEYQRRDASKSLLNHEDFGKHWDYNDLLGTERILTKIKLTVFELGKNIFDHKSNWDLK